MRAIQCPGIHIGPCRARAGSWESVLLCGGGGGPGGLPWLRTDCRRCLAGIREVGRAAVCSHFRGGWD